MDGFHLPAARVASVMKTSLHLSSPVAGGRLFRGTTDQRWNQGADATLVPRVVVRRFAVIPGVGRYGDQPHSSSRLVEGGAIMLDVRPWPMRRHHGQNHVTGAVAEDARLGKPSVGEILPLFSPFFSPPHIVAAGVMRLESGAVQRGQGHAFAYPAHDGPDMDRFVQQAAGGSRDQQPLSRFLERREVGNLFQVDRVAQIGSVSFGASKPATYRRFKTGHGFWNHPPNRYDWQAVAGSVIRFCRRDRLGFAVASGSGSAPAGDKSSVPSSVNAGAGAAVCLRSR